MYLKFLCMQPTAPKYTHVDLLFDLTKHLSVYPKDLPNSPQRIEEKMLILLLNLIYRKK